MKRESAALRLLPLPPDTKVLAKRAKFRFADFKLRWLQRCLATFVYQGQGRSRAFCGVMLSE